MRFLALAALLIMASITGSAQDVSILPILPIPAPSYQELKTYLTLTDAQVTSLTTIARTRSEAQSAIYRQISEKYQALHNLLNTGSTDAVRIGQLMIEINNLQKQTIPTEPYRSQALAVLSAEQKLKLPTLAQAIQMQAPAWQAGSLNLIDTPQPRPLPAGVGSSIGGIDSIFPVTPTNPNSGQ